MTFAEFEIDAAAGKLTRDGVRVKLQDLPFRLLVALLRRPGAVVTRDALRAELWGAETFVDAEAGLNTAIGKLRDALGDNAETPRFIETLPKRGYRFIGDVNKPAAVTTVPAEESRTVTGSGSTSPGLREVAGLVALALLVMALAGYRAYSAPDRVTIAVVRFHNETGVANYDRLAGTLTDAVVVALAQDQKYAVIGNSPLLRTDRIFQDVRKIGGALHAEYVVLGQLQQGDAGLLVRAHFIRVSDEKHFWATPIDIAGASDTEQRVTSKVTSGVATGLQRAASAR